MGLDLASEDTRERAEVELVPAAELQEGDRVWDDNGHFRTITGFGRWVEGSGREHWVNAQLDDPILKMWLDAPRDQRVLRLAVVSPSPVGTERCTCKKASEGMMGWDRSMIDPECPLHGTDGLGLVRPSEPMTVEQRLLECEESLLQTQRELAEALGVAPPVDADVERLLQNAYDTLSQVYWAARNGQIHIRDMQDVLDRHRPLLGALTDRVVSRVRRPELGDRGVLERIRDQAALEADDTPSGLVFSSIANEAEAALGRGRSLADVRAAAPPVGVDEREWTEAMVEAAAKAIWGETVREQIAEEGTDFNVAHMDYDDAEEWRKAVPRNRARAALRAALTGPAPSAGRVFQGPGELELSGFTEHGADAPAPTETTK